MARPGTLSPVTLAVAVLIGCADGPSSRKITSYPPAPAGLDLELSTYLERFFCVYENHEGKITRITGWDDAPAALAFLHTTADFFERARR